MGLVDQDGKPLKKVSQEPARAGHDLVQCSILIGDMEQLKVCLPMKIMTPKGPMMSDVNGLLTSIAMNLYNVMRHAKQKEIIIRVADLSSELVADKQLTVELLPLVPPDLEEILKEGEDGKEEQQTEG